MITCKIIADFDSAEGDFSALFNALSPLGALLCPDGDAIFFGSSSENVDKRKVKRILRKCGYPDSVIVEYGIGNAPKETPVINGWIFDHITQNAILRLGKDNRDAIRDGIRQLDEIDAMIEREMSGAKAADSPDAMTEMEDTDGGGSEEED